MGARFDFSEHDEKKLGRPAEGRPNDQLFAVRGVQELTALQRLPTSSIPGAIEKRSQPGKQESAPAGEAAKS
jgi:hypothetical protein